MPVLVFKQSGRWANPPGQGSVEVEAGVPVDVCDFIARNAVKAGRAEPLKAKKKEMPSPVVKADEEKIGPEVKAEKAPLKPKAKKRTRKKSE